VAAGREVQELVAAEEQIGRPRLALAGLALARVTGNLIAAERGLRRLLPLLTLLVYGDVFGGLLVCFNLHHCASPQYKPKMPSR
jgi:hypothetical protein